MASTTKGTKILKGQGSMELLVTLGVVLAFTIPVLFLLLSITSVGYEKTALAQADATARSLADTMNQVYAQGPGASKLVLLNAPASTQEVYVTNGEVVVSVKTSNGVFDAAAPTFARIAATATGKQTVGKKVGLFKVLVQNVEAEDGGSEVKIIDVATPG